MDTDEFELLTVSEFAEAVGRSERQIYRCIRNDKIKAMKPCPSEGFKIPATEVDRFVKEFGSRQTSSTTDSQVTASNDVTAATVQLQLQLLESLDFANEKLLRSERHRISLEMELKQHQLLLTENAESLQHKTAQEKEYEDKLQSANSDLEAKEHHLQELETKLAALQSENEQLWSEKRRPWWKKMFTSKAQ